MRTCNLTLDAADVFQVLDALNDRAISWERTADYLREDGGNGGDLFIAEECSDPDEADAIAKHFRDIAAKINAQI